MAVISWFLSVVVALLATATIAMALPRSASDELSATAPQSVFSIEMNRVDAMLASCVPKGD
ncbi:hypothetical protein BTHE68_64270 (plasmid) [Burkholderia sp. THE68]|jgi:hypothetical protein|uniref:hypothetical protein n=1 Tax=Burkholderiaceae TaxID=119060 RepID=UPI001317E5DC|nr:MULTISPECIES: hypothetical protein [Burkholderiaceae]BBU32693.1 hypothetical protein BTHE68_64270 [Burkholderia sp. THE68]BCQ26945.1 hypothetical protein NK8_51340 [Caballeronia sp. NK8]